MSKQLGIYVNQQFCTGCKTCQIACKDKHDLEVGANLLRLKEFSGGGFTRVGEAFEPHVWAYWVPVYCNHCTAPTCVAACPVGAIHKSAADGVVSIDPDACIGCRICLDSCPYGSLQFSEKEQKAKKCDLCADYRAEGKEPSCVISCPMRVLGWGEVETIQEEHPEAVTGLRGLPDPDVTRPNTLYTPHRHALREAGHE
ncbi:MAG TPA: 4Fe-4S dicluster domain-containing protein [Geobacteraceae bacterium]